MHPAPHNTLIHRDTYYSDIKHYISHRLFAMDVDAAVGVVRKYLSEVKIPGTHDKVCVASRQQQPTTIASGLQGRVHVHV